MFNEKSPIDGKSKYEIQGNEKIHWRADNLQDHLTMEALQEAIEKYGSLKVMKHLQKLS